MSMAVRDIELGVRYWIVHEHESPPRLQAHTATQLHGGRGGGWDSVEFAGACGSPGNVFHFYDRGQAEVRLRFVMTDWTNRQMVRMHERLVRVEQSIVNLTTAAENLNASVNLIAEYMKRTEKLG